VHGTWHFAFTVLALEAEEQTMRKLRRRFMIVAIVVLVAAVGLHAYDYLVRRNADDRWLLDFESRVAAVQERIEVNILASGMTVSEWSDMVDRQTARQVFNGGSNEPTEEDLRFILDHIVYPLRESGDHRSFKENRRLGRNAHIGTKDNLRRAAEKAVLAEMPARPRSLLPIVYIAYQCSALIAVAVAVTQVGIMSLWSYRRLTHLQARTWIMVWMVGILAALTAIAIGIWRIT
jgi:hypothetical protein